MISKINSRKLVFFGLWVFMALGAYGFINKLGVKLNFINTFFICFLSASIVLIALIFFYLASSKGKWKGIAALMLITCAMSLCAILIQDMSETIVADKDQYVISELAFPLVGFFAGLASLFLARVFLKDSKSLLNVFVGGYFLLTGLALLFSFFLVNVLIGWIRVLGY